MKQMQMFMDAMPAVTETPCFLVLISTARGVYHSYVDASDREAAKATGHFIALESLDLESGDYNISVSQATRRKYN